MKQQPNNQPFSSSTRANSSAAVGSTLYHGAYSSWKHYRDGSQSDSQVQVAEENQNSQQISVHLADVAAKAALRANRSPYSSA